jgi:hypothetical protein
MRVKLKWHDPWIRICSCNLNRNWNVSSFIKHIIEGLCWNFLFNLWLHLGLNWFCSLFFCYITFNYLLIIDDNNLKWIWKQNTTLPHNNHSQAIGIPNFKTKHKNTIYDCIKIFSRAIELWFKKVLPM